VVGASKPAVCRGPTAEDTLRASRSSGFDCSLHRTWQRTVSGHTSGFGQQWVVRLQLRMHHAPAAGARSHARTRRQTSQSQGAGSMRHIAHRHSNASSAVQRAACCTLHTALCALHSALRSAAAAQTGDRRSEIRDQRHQMWSCRHDA
jgi:hypothetical protein